MNSGFKFKLALLCGMATVAFSARAEDVAAQKDWTILVFLNGNNSLDSFGPVNIKQMEKVGSSDHVNVVVQWASYSTKQTKRFLVTKSSDPNNITSPILSELGQVDMGSVDNFVAFVEWGIKNFPAKHYLVDIWNHGNGWQKQGSITRDASYDDLSGNKITTEQMGPGMAQIKAFLGRNIDILGFDACLMAMAEIDGEVAPSTDYLVGSEDLEPGNGWPYDDFLNAMYSGNTIQDPKAVAAALVNSYGAAYDGGSQGTENVTLATHDLGAFRDMYPALANLSTALNQAAKTNPAALNTAIGSTLAFYGSDYKDLGGLVTQLQNSRGTGIDASVLNAVATQLKNVVTSNKPTGTFKTAQGLSIWIPSEASSSWSEYGTRYQGFTFDKETDWSKWIETLAGSKSK